MAIDRARATIGRVFFQRCFYLFAAVLLLVAGAPLVDPTPAGRLALNLVNVFIVVAAVAAVGRSVLSFVVVLLLGAATLGLQWLALRGAAGPDLLVTPLSRQARSLCVVEQITGALFLAILIARLAGVYPPTRGREPE